MKLLGVIGGMSWESTALYYRGLNQRIAQRLGGHHSARLLLWSVDFAGIEALQREGRWDEASAQRHGLEVIAPDADDRAVVHRVIYDELCHGRVLDASRETYRRIMERLIERGAQGVILGCTEITMLIGAEDARVPLFDTTALHVQAAADWMTAENPT